MRVLQIGSQGQEVHTLQQHLNAQLTPSPRLKADGIFGSKTRSAVVAFQARWRLTQDGVVGPQTWSALGKTDATNVGGGVRVGVRDNDPTVSWKTPYGEAILDNFDIDSAALKPEHVDWLHTDLAPFLLKNPEYAIRIEGFTSRTGDALYNRELSRRRAEGVAKRLAVEGVNSNRWVIVSHGESQSKSKLEEDSQERAVLVTIRSHKPPHPKPKPKWEKGTPGKPDDEYVPWIPPNLDEKYEVIRTVNLTYCERFRTPGTNAVDRQVFPNKKVLVLERFVKKESTAVKKVTSQGRDRVDFSGARSILLSNWIEWAVATITDYEYSGSSPPPPFDLHSMNGDQIEALYRNTP
jgi:outer membrane protein OmpA-like peptidoglycan-associated protein